MWELIKVWFNIVLSPSKTEEENQVLKDTRVSLRVLCLLIETVTVFFFPILKATDFSSKWGTPMYLKEDNDFFLFKSQVSKCYLPKFYP